jgi:hypothetical protein
MEFCEHCAINCAGRSLLARVINNATQWQVFTGGWTFQMTIHDVKILIISKCFTRW